MSKTAFTLSEVLITLGIIGVVSTLTLPNLTNSYRRNVAMTKIEKGYAQLAQAYEQSLEDNGTADMEIPDSHYSDSYASTAYFYKHWKPYLKSPILCKTYRECGYSSGSAGEIHDKTGDTIYSLYESGGKDRHAVFMTNEGIVYIISISGYYIYMDINGGKSPNVLGKDVFRLEISEQDGIMPDGYDSDETKEQLKAECYDNGYGCLEYFRRNGWEAPSDYKF